jgi:hypothetical protein
MLSDVAMETCTELDHYTAPVFMRHNRKVSMIRVETTAEKTAMSPSSASE